ncbi:MAG: two-component system response regulator [Desulfobacterales bacterium]|nr:two-component system response regulator [Desulfobacterales bacterium]MBF0395432.1 two-component system response regulator [Desulfobacterales bacterium]
MENIKPEILIVDDEPFNITILVNILKSQYRTIVAKNGEEALQRAKIESIPDLILLDIMMPDMDGYTVCRKLKQDNITKDIPIIFITALGEELDESRGFESGGVDYITKPIKPLILKARVKTHIELRKAQLNLYNQNMILEEKVLKRTKDLFDSQIEIVHRLVSAAEYKDPETGSHITRMSYYTMMLAKSYGLEKKDCENIFVASPMHDIGKIGIPDSILLKPGKLDRDEWEIMKTHTNIGAKILANSSSNLLQFGQQIAISHHEKWDGSGYPQGLKGEKISVFGRITALADVFDALTTKRPYKDPWPVDKAIDEIRIGRGKHFDPDIVDAFEKVLPEFIEIKQKFID